MTSKSSKGKSAKAKLKQHSVAPKPAMEPLGWIEELAAKVPPEAWENLPKDGAANLDHYLYGAPKRKA
jgi:hypothetical protein